jgi:hypothetical protein
MLSAIGFDDDSALYAGEIGNAASDSFLLPELEPAKLAIAKTRPKSTLGVRRFAPEPACVRIDPADGRHCVSAVKKKKTLTRSPIGESTSPASGRGEIRRLRTLSRVRERAG